MKALYVDCRLGIAGDMFVAAMLDAGIPSETVADAFNRLPVKPVRFVVEKLVRSGISGTMFTIEDDRHFHSFEEQKEIIEDSELEDDIKTLALKILTLIRDAEARVHGVNDGSVHFHEMASLDTVADAVAAATLAVKSCVGAVFASPVGTGSGRVKIAHGEMPVPAPAVAELLKGMPLTGSDLEGEATTPTGAAVLKALEPQFILPEGFVIESTGYGFGSVKKSHPNFLRVFLGRMPAAAGPVYEVEANIDDSTPESLAYAVSSLLEQGALDAWLESLVMKKGRPGQKLCFLCRPEDLDRLIELVFRHTSTIGVRYSIKERRIMERQVERVKTRYGEVRVKVSRSPSGTVRVAAEHDDCAALAERYGLPIDAVKREAEHQCERKLGLKNSD